MRTDRGKRFLYRKGGKICRVRRSWKSRSGKFGKTNVNEIISLVRSFGIARLGVIIGVTIGVAAALALIIARIGTPSMSVLYADINYTEAQSIIERLEQDGVRHEMRDTGSRVTILVDRGQVSTQRVRLASDGVMVGSGVGYEIFDDNQALGATSFQQGINRLRALEGELARTLSSINGVRSARVHLVLPERELFARDRQTASASIVVDAPSGLDARAVRAIVNLTASAVPALDASRVTILDSAGKLLASGAEGDDADSMSGSVEDRKIAAEARIRRNVEDIVGRIVGAENVRVEVSAEMDFSRVTESAEIVDPDSQTVLSSTTIEESSNSNEPGIGQGVTVANALPGAQPFIQGTAAATSAQQRTEETTNYEISKTVRNAVREEGLVVKRLSAAVAINGMTQSVPGAAPSYAPRSPEELARIETLVKTAIGYNEARGDQVSIVDIQFSPLPVVNLAPPAAVAPTLAREDVMRLAEIGALAVIAFGLVVFVLRPMLAAPTQDPLLTASAYREPPKTAGDGQAEGAAPALPYAPESGLEHNIDLAQVEGQVKASSINKVSEIVKAHTDESANILRNWMQETS